MLHTDAFAKMVRERCSGANWVTKDGKITGPEGYLPATLGNLLRQWRQAAGLSQLDLALDLGTSTRHLSFLESGKARPSEAMLNAIMLGLDVPSSEHNTLRLASGFKPLADINPKAPQERGQVRRIIEQVKVANASVPLLVKDQIWDVIDANDLARNVFRGLLGRDIFAASPFINVLELVFASDLLRPKLINWEEVADATVRHVRYETGLASENPAFRAVLERVSTMPGFASRWTSIATGSAGGLATRYIFDLPDGQRAYDSILTSLGAPYESLLSGVRFDTFHPVATSVKY